MYNPACRSTPDGLGLTPSYLSLAASQRCLGNVSLQSQLRLLLLSTRPRTGQSIAVSSSNADEKTHDVAAAQRRTVGLCYMLVLPVSSYDDTPRGGTKTLD